MVQRLLCSGTCKVVSVSAYYTQPTCFWLCIVPPVESALLCAIKIEAWPFLIIACGLHSLGRVPLAYVVLLTSAVKIAQGQGVSECWVSKCWCVFTLGLIVHR